MIGVRPPGLITQLYHIVRSYGEVIATGAPCNACDYVLIGGTSKQ
jgi:hypothetical protein